ncbi:hypothetical protein CK203_074288 [Vitis vinifera]|uniref:Retrotransposon Copia-like N-terminal domain-containing protein n=1 Tax=Vitis vinifera TaxID=29760 RepID=A0A438BYW2_VITVI|nr:hypothetical protein CK203_074288 [Vitis vinifera]
MGDYRRAFTGLSKDGSKEGSNQSSSSTLTINPTASFDHSSLQITSYKLNGRNLFQWSQSVMAWLINSMEEHIGSLYLVHNTTNAIWDKIWQELDIFEPTNWCGECAGKYAKLVEKQRTYDFLISLNKDLDEVRGRMLGTHPLPQIEEIFTEVHREESKRKYILGDSKTPLQTKPQPSLPKTKNHNTQLKIPATHNMHARVIFGVISAKDQITTGKIVGNCMDQSSGKKIGNASEDGGLYYFDEDTDESKQAQTVSWESPSLTRKD